MKTAKIVKSKPALKKIRAIEDCATGNWSYEFAFTRADGRSGHVVVPGADANKPTSLIDHLNRKGAALPTEPQERKALVTSVVASKADEIIRQVASAGWQGNKLPFFTCGSRIIGAPVGKIVAAPPALTASSGANKYSERGELVEWSTKIAGTALYSTALTVGICAGLAAPLVRFSGLQNFTLHVSGHTRAGKTSTLLCATSVAGLGDEEAVTSWNGTNAELLAAASAFSDIVFPLNEVGAAAGKTENVYKILRTFYARYAEGGDRARHPSWEAAHGGPAKRFRGICISTAEHSVAQYAQSTGVIRDGGELFRAIDVIPLRQGMATVLDLAPDTVDQHARLEALRDNLKVCHGTALPAYVEHLIGMGLRRVERRVLTLVNIFVGRMPVAAHDAVAREMAKHFGLLYAGGASGI